MDIELTEEQCWSVGPFYHYHIFVNTALKPTFGDKGNVKSFCTIIHDIPFSVLYFFLLKSICNAGECIVIGKILLL